MTFQGSDRIGLGLAALGRPAYLTTGRDRDFGTARSIADMRARTAEVLNAAYAGGIRYVDAARSYGRAEEFLADWLNSRPDVTDLYVASKWGYRYVGDWRLDSEVHEIKEHTLAAFQSQLQETRTLLGNRVDLYQVHSLTDDSPVLRDTELQHALSRLRDEGVRVGLSTSGARQATAIRAALELHVGGLPLFSSVQATWNLLETSAAPALAEAHQAGAAIVVKECFANGRLAPGGHDTSPSVRRVAQLAADVGVGVDQLAIAAAVQQPWAPRVLSGAVTVSQVESHLVGAGLDLPPQMMTALADVCEQPADYWTTRSRRAWT
jgi:aryl-alcohol dehydrogenase-like predicted oxidoreductase